MNDAYQQLRIVARTEVFRNIVEGCYNAIHLTGLPRQTCMHHTLDRLQSLFGLKAELQHGGTSFVLYLSGARANIPPCIVVSEYHGQQSSPSSMLVLCHARHMVQVFEGGADDTDDMDKYSTPLANRIESKGRALQC